jgi:Tol biopolymer transport system component
MRLRNLFSLAGKCLQSIWRTLFLAVMMLSISTGCAAESTTSAPDIDPSNETTSTQPYQTEEGTVASTSTEMADTTVTAEVSASITPPAESKAGIKVISVNEGGKPATGEGVQLSYNGQLATYLSEEMRLYIHDLAASTVLPVEFLPPQNCCTDYAISGNGNVIVFFGFGLSETPLAGCPDSSLECGSLYVYDLAVGDLEQLPVTIAQTNAKSLSVSEDGRFVAFASAWAFVNEGVYLFDRSTKTLTTISKGDDAHVGEGSRTGGTNVSISADGRFVAFASSDDGLVTGDSNGVSDVFVYDRDGGHIDRISTPPDGVESGQASGFQDVPNTGGAVEQGLAISSDGRYVVFMSAASNLINADLQACKHWPLAPEFPACRHIYLYDRDTGEIELISVANDGTPGNRASEEAAVSANGRWVVFTSLASNLSSLETNRCGIELDYDLCKQVYVRDRATGKTTPVSQGWDGQWPNGYSDQPVITPDGRYVAFVSSADNLLPDMSHSPNNTVRYAFMIDLWMLLGIEQSE